mmetsp:Transcript_59448/g.106061  ORF Transcript_59448/g.106061 Transcript_59448/m.106061 type:complete len:236 (+) Transcript_59448:410-1117(+)
MPVLARQVHDVVAVLVDAVEEVHPRLAHGLAAAEDLVEGGVVPDADGDVEAVLPLRGQDRGLDPHVEQLPNHLRVACKAGDVEGLQALVVGHGGDLQVFLWALLLHHSAELQRERRVIGLPRRDVKGRVAGLVLGAEQLDLVHGQPLGLVPLFCQVPRVVARGPLLDLRVPNDVGRLLPALGAHLLLLLLLRPFLLLLDKVHVHQQHLPDAGQPHDRRGVQGVHPLAVRHHGRSS